NTEATATTKADTEQTHTIKAIIGISKMAAIRMLSKVETQTLSSLPHSPAGIRRGRSKEDMDKVRMQVTDKIRTRVTVRS
ncbi:MAG: hypothetical protein Q9183_006464, partial [Haloplaca sp. 2 TL-2023]